MPSAAIAEAGDSDDRTPLAWPGPGTKAEAYLRLMAEVALPDYRATPGNLRAWCLHRRDGDLVHVEMLSFWEDEAAVRRFAGDDMTKARYYDFDREFLLEFEPTAEHFAVIGGQGSRRPPRNITGVRPFRLRSRPANGG